MKADFCLLNNEIQVLKEMFEDAKLKSIANVYVELLLMKHAFPTTMSLIVAAMAIRAHRVQEFWTRCPDPSKQFFLDPDPSNWTPTQT